MIAIGTFIKKIKQVTSSEKSDSSISSICTSIDSKRDALLPPDKEEYQTGSFSSKARKFEDKIFDFKNLNELQNNSRRSSFNVLASNARPSGAKVSKLHFQTLKSFFICGLGQAFDRGKCKGK